MSEQRIKELINELIKELESTDGVAEEAVSVARQLEGKIDDLVNPEVDTSENTILDDAIALEASFAASHPVAEKLIRELINTLSRIGI
jgi:copper chaperone CopZ